MLPPMLLLCIFRPSCRVRRMHWRRCGAPCLHPRLGCLCAVCPCRDEVASCSERAYESLSVSDAVDLLMLGSEAEVEAYARQVCVRATV